ncbi:GNAT family N-acetyltransferase [Dactylosporangium matsuzakiense]|nr:GNAT family N-acetyltransferase [Dactylosporangium matsuzakiense]
MEPVAADWDDPARLLGPGAFADLFSAAVTPPGDWEPVFELDGFQMVLDRPATAPAGAEPSAAALSAGASSAALSAAASSAALSAGASSAARPTLVRLGLADVPDMLALTEQARPGPFWARTIEMGAFYGVREEGALVAMAGERLAPPGWTEISAVCTAPHARGRGLAERVVRRAIDGVLGRGERVLLHVAAANTGAIRLYERLGFVVRSPVRFHGYRVPPEPLRPAA